MQAPQDRRSFLIGAGAALAGLGAAPLRRTHRAAPATVDDIAVISKEPRHYHGWPTLTRRRNGELLLVYSGGREAHVCPFGRVELMRSRDGGGSWSWPRVLADSPIDDRDAGVLETARGTILVTWFTSLAYEAAMVRADRDAVRRERWQAAHDRVDAAGRRAELGVWMVRSTDGGVSFSRRYDCLVDSPHGPVRLADGRLLYAGKDLWRERRVGVCESTDDGESWRWLATIPPRDGDDPEQYHELHAVEAADGRIVVQLRNHNRQNQRETLQAESSDGGETWSKPRAIGVWGLPSHLLRLGDDRLLMTYGHRRAPLGNQARWSADHGRTWSEPIAISADGTSADLGYPSTVELEGGALLTVWYERLAESDKAVLRQARWRLDG